MIWGVLPLGMILLKTKGLYKELLLGFFFILILSDSRQPSLAFAGQVKNIYIVMLALFIFVNRSEFSPLNTFFKKFLPFFAVATVCLFFSNSFNTAVQKTLSYFLLLLIVPNYLLKAYSTEDSKAMRDIVYFGAFILLMGFVLRFATPNVVTLSGRYSGILGNPNGLGIFCVLYTITVFVILEYFPEIMDKRGKLLVGSLIVASLILCGSRGALITILIFLFFRYFYKISPFLGFVIFLTITLSYQLITNNIEAIIIGFGLQEYFRLETFESGSGRMIAWEFALKKVENSILLGNGFGYTDALFKSNYSELSKLGHQGNAHNSYLTVWLDTGLIGLILFIGAYLKAFFEGAKNSRLAIPALYAVLFSINFESWLSASLNPFTIQLIIIATLLSAFEFNSARQEVPADEQAPGDGPIMERTEAA